MSLSSVAAVLSFALSVPHSVSYFKVPRGRSGNKYISKINLGVSVVGKTNKRNIKGKERNEICPCCGWFKKKKCNCRYNTQLREGSD